VKVVDGPTIVVGAKNEVTSVETSGAVLSGAPGVRLPSADLVVIRYLATVTLFGTNDTHIEEPVGETDKLVEAVDNTRPALLLPDVVAAKSRDGDITVFGMELSREEIEPCKLVFVGATGSGVALPVTGAELPENGRTLVDGDEDRADEDAVVLRPSVVGEEGSVPPPAPIEGDDEIDIDVEGGGT
jgi:hypothetical protein